MFKSLLSEWLIMSIIGYKEGGGNLKLYLVEEKSK